MQKTQKTAAKLNKKLSLHEFYWNFRDPTSVLLPKVGLKYHLGTISVHLPASEVLLGSLGDPKIAKISMKINIYRPILGSKQQVCMKIADF